MSPRYLIDTMIFIDHLKAISGATDWLSSLKTHEGAISVITLAEFLTGISKEEEDISYLLLADFECLPIQASTARLAADLRRTWHWKLPDAFQAAIAIENHLLLVTRNTKDFSPKKHPFVTIPY